MLGTAIKANEGQSKGQLQWANWPLHNVDVLNGTEGGRPIPWLSKNCVVSLLQRLEVCTAHIHPAGFPPYIHVHGLLCLSHHVHGGCKLGLGVTKVRIVRWAVRIMQLSQCTGRHGMASAQQLHICVHEALACATLNPPQRCVSSILILWESLRFQANGQHYCCACETREGIHSTCQWC